MRNLKKFLALVLAMMMALSLLVTANASMSSSFDETDYDQVTSTYREAVNLLDALGVIKGDENGKFNPKSTITRAEMAAILYRVVTGDVLDANVHLYKAPQGTYFTDVRDEAWYNGYVNFCANNGLIQGVGNNRFAPSSNLTGYEALVMVLRAIGYNNPSEFSNPSDWRFKASGYGSRLGLTANVAAGSLGGSATREVMAEIIFRALQAPTVTYSPLTMYTENVLVPAGYTVTYNNGTSNIDVVTYRNTRYSDLLYEVFGVVGKQNIYDTDEFGRPMDAWVKDSANDSLETGTLYVPNSNTALSAADFVAMATASSPVAIPGSIGGNNGDLNGDTFVNATDYTSLRQQDFIYTGARALYEYYLDPVGVYCDVITECKLMQDVNNDQSIDATNNLTEVLNGGAVATRGSIGSEYIMDALHTTTSDSNYTVGAPGRITEVYKLTRSSSPDYQGIARNNFIIVYIDTFLGTVTSVTDRTLDTAGHVMTQAELVVAINGEPVSVYDYSNTNYSYKAGDLILLQTYGLQDEADIEVENLQKTIPYTANDFNGWGFDNLGNVGANLASAVVTVGPANTATITVNATRGAADFKTGLVSTTNTEYPGNVVYLANGAADTDNYHYSTGSTETPDGTAHTTNAIDGERTVPGNYTTRMLNEGIGQQYTVVTDNNGYVVGLRPGSVGSDTGVIVAMDSERVSYGRYAVVAEMIMMDGTTKEVRFLDNDPTNAMSGTGANGPATVGWDYFKTSNDADESFTGGTYGYRNLAARPYALVTIQPFNKDGETYYMVTATHSGSNTPFAANGAEQEEDNQIITGVADSLSSGNFTSAGITYAGSPTIGANNMNDRTTFLIAEIDYRYNAGQANLGGYTSMVYTSYTGFKNIPTIQGDDLSIPGSVVDILWQRIGNNVFIYPNIPATEDTAGAADNSAELTYTMKAPATYPVDETYLILGTIATYADHSTYKALKDGVLTTLEVSNANLGGGNPNLVLESTLNPTSGNYAALVRVDSRSTRDGYITQVTLLTDPYNTAGSSEKTRTILNANATTLAFNQNGVMHFDNVVSHPTSSADIAGVNFLTVDDNCTVQIVNLTEGTYSNNASLASLWQYAHHGSTVQLVYELNQYGYVSHVYIID